MGFLDVAEKLAKVKQSVADGKRIDMLKIDPPVTPAILLGYDDVKRLESITIIIYIQFRV